LINIAKNVIIGTFVTLETKVTIVTRKLYVEQASIIVVKVPISLRDVTVYCVLWVEGLRKSAKCHDLKGLLHVITLAKRTGARPCSPETKEIYDVIQYVNSRPTRRTGTAITYCVPSSYVTYSS